MPTLTLSIFPIFQRVSQQLSCTSSYNSNPWMTRQYKEALSMARCAQWNILKIKIIVEALHYSFFPVWGDVCSKCLLTREITIQENISETLRSMMC